ncbi:hypothetical protein B0H14DRAFT_3153348 [Mycena olivaceomarginata]|nr:hypothetical protein B0H14DRAFT_3153348 [Mycena olivaceomarginata]
MALPYQPSLLHLVVVIVHEHTALLRRGDQAAERLDEAALLDPLVKLALREECRVVLALVLASLEFGGIRGGVSDDDEEVEVAFGEWVPQRRDPTRWTVWILVGICSVFRREGMLDWAMAVEVLVKQKQIDQAPYLTAVLFDLKSAHSKFNQEFNRNFQHECT